MPPKKASATDTWTGKAGCRGRDVTPLQQYILDKSKQRGYLASLLNKDGFLDQFAADVSANECAFTFDDSDWFAVYLVDSDGQYFLDATGGRQPGRLFFKVMFDSATGQPKIDPSSRTFVMPPDLIGKRECMVSPTGTCVIRQVPKEPKKPKKPKKLKTPASASASASAPASASASSSAPTDSGTDEYSISKAMEMLAAEGKASKVVKQPVEELIKAVEQLQVGGGPSGSSEEVQGNITTADLSNKSIDEIIQWMVENMYEQDIMSCLRSGTLSSEEQAKLVELQGLSTEAVVPDPGELADEIAVQAAATLPPEVARKMYKRITKDDLIKELSNLKGGDRKNAIAQLCRRSGRNVEVRERSGRRGKVVYDLYERGFLVTDEEIDDVLNECADREADRLQSLLRSRWARVLPRKAAVYRVQQAQQETERRRIPIVEETQEEADMRVAAETGGTAPKMTKDELMQLVDGAPNRKEGIYNACQVVGIPMQRGERPGRGGKTTIVEYKIDGAPVANEEWEDILEECITKLSSMGFGRPRPKACKRMPKRGKKPIKVSKVRSNFKCAARKCKKTNDYAGCMKKTLRKIYKSVAKPRTAGLYNKRGASFGNVCGNYPQVPSFGKKKKKKKGKAVEIFKKAAKKCKGSSDYRKCFTKTLRKMHSVSFGKKKGKAVEIFKKAAKKCKGSSDYRKCFKKTLRKMHSASFGKRKKQTPSNRSLKFVYRNRSTHPKRKSPRVSATSVSVGTIKKGVDGNHWKVKKTKTGVKRWVKL